GVPLLTTNYYKEYIGVPGLKVGNNAIIAHHFGFAGSLLQKIPYKLLTTYRKNYGHYRNVGVDAYEHYYADDPRGYIKLDKNVFSTKLQLQIPNPILDLKLYAGGDFSKSENNIGAGIGVSKEF
ncbi:MAG: hypothetical protein VX712_13230, partial [Bacteroidota bacterium]|nr:hypothetical protein [Bacteroidota bacterium]